ncbi:site-specific integrase [Pseudomonas juntendi]|uniref:site-specific integrase n=1 Tax=Pseudomonas juntendi TaxID=2666183 RepID=UPI003019FF1D
MATFQTTRSFFKWADSNEKTLSLGTIEQVFLDWCDWNFDATRTRPTAAQTAFGNAARVGALIDDALDRTSTIISLSRLRKKTKPKNWGRESDKIDFSKLFAMGEALVDICESLTAEVVRGPLPINISYRDGKTTTHWCGLIPTEKLKWNGLLGENKKALPRRERRISDVSWNSRHSIMNLRLEAEILIFIAQTQINLTQALELKVSKVTYQSITTGYKVANLHKARRGGEVSFDIYSEYRQHFDRYLKWREQIFPDDELLFPLRSHATKTPGTCPVFRAVRNVLKDLDISYVNPRALRLSKVNWLLRKTRDPSLTAEMAQHTETTLLQSYERPNHQAALSELTRYHQAQESALAPPGPGMCVSPEPLLINSALKGTPKPDCANPAGCLFCVHQRDIAELDHVWSLFSYRYLKSVELATHRPTTNESVIHPAKIVVDAVTAKIDAFSKIDEFKAWIAESAIRLDEGRFHPKWDGFIKLMEYRL